MSLLSSFLVVKALAIIAVITVYLIVTLIIIFKK